MTQSEYVLKNEELISKIKLLQSELSELRESYKTENMPFLIGQKVEITVPAHEAWNGNINPEVKQIGFISGYGLSPKGDFAPYFDKSKKNGERSQHSLDIGYSAQKIMQLKAIN